MLICTLVPFALSLFSPLPCTFWLSHCLLARCSPLPHGGAASCSRRLGQRIYGQQGATRVLIAKPRECHRSKGRHGLACRHWVSIWICSSSKSFWRALGGSTGQALRLGSPRLLIAPRQLRSPRGAQSPHGDQPAQGLVVFRRLGHLRGLSHLRAQPPQLGSVNSVLGHRRGQGHLRARLPQGARPHSPLPPKQGREHLNNPQGYRRGKRRSSPSL